METKKLTVLVDIDDTIEYLLRAWIDWLNEKHGTSVKYDDVTDWDISTFFPALTTDEVFYPLHQEDFWKRVKPMPDAIEYLKRLMDDGSNVYLCTCTDYRNVRPKYEYIIQKHFPYIDWSQVIVASKKQMINADVLVDDGVHNLCGGDYYKILFTAPHNRAFDAEAHGMTRADNWGEVYRIVCEYADKKGREHN